LLRFVGMTAEGKRKKKRGESGMTISNSRGIA
jgi:hypothetical protein